MEAQYGDTQSVQQHGGDVRPTTCPESAPAGERGNLSGDQQTETGGQQCNQAAGEKGNPSKDQQGKTASQQCNQATASSSESKMRCSYLTFPVPNLDRLNAAKALVKKAVRNHKIFLVQGSYPIVRAALKTRGWVERCIPRLQPHSLRQRKDENDEDTMDSDDDDDSPEDAEKEDGLYDLMSRLVRNETVYFYWTSRREAVDNHGLNKDQIINHFSRGATFITKVGLCLNLRNLHWFDATKPDTFFPRCYRLGADDDRHAFIEDFRRTACISLLKCVVDGKRVEQGAGKSGGKDQSDPTKRFKRRVSASLPSQMIESALKVCQEFLDSLEHIDIDISLDTPQALTEKQWSEFIDNFYRVAHDGAKIEDSVHFVDKCQEMLSKMREVSPQMDTDGINNIWIIKPGAMSRGRGIICGKHLDDILQLVHGDPAMITDSKWVVQKYLEKPLLIHGTKFDVRQWFMVTDWNPLTVWFYKKCYLRFSTQPYSLTTLDSSVHLCNNSIQKHLQPSEQRHPAIPADNMWSCEQFRAFLSGQGRGALWESVVVPGMKKAVIYSVQTAQDRVECRKNTFELYGADFILGTDLRPWLLEINASPTMAPSTEVTTTLCAAVQEDTLRVVLDRRLDKRAGTGGFELIYKQAAVEVPQYLGVNLLVEGSHIKRPRAPPPPKPSNPPEPRPAPPPPPPPPPPPRRCATAREKPLVVEKPKAPSRKWLKTVMCQVSCRDTSNVRPVPPLPLEPPLPNPIDSFRLYLPRARPDTLRMPTTAQSNSMDCWRRRLVPRPCSKKMSPYSLKKHRSTFLPLEVLGLYDKEQSIHKYSEKTLDNKDLLRILRKKYF